MSFNSYVFVLLFLPLAICGFYLCVYRFGTVASRYWLVVVSLLFYAWYNPHYLYLLLESLFFNFVCAKNLNSTMKQRKLVLFVGIVVNLSFLGYFKYANFFIDNTNAFFGQHFQTLEIVLPLAISFFTLQQIAFLMDVYEGLTEEKSLIDYLLFVTFFPKLIAGPIVHHRDMMPQFFLDSAKRFNERWFIYGIFVFSVGLFKKVIIADNLADVANAGFNNADILTATDAWFATIAYTFQVYFDFSGYSDMAVGIGLMFNIRLPLNFNSPYKSTSIIAFWQRWHMTLTGFINEYVYMPMMRLRETFSFHYSLWVTMIAMAVVGLWHGASWNFVLFGVLHGIALVVNHLWRRYGFAFSKVFGWMLTFFWWHLTLVIFRSADVKQAWAVYQAMFTGAISLASKPVFGSVSLFKEFPIEIATGLIVILSMVLLICCVWLKNPHDHEALFKPSFRYFVVTFACLFFSVLFIGHVTEFIYFQF